jgi:hypothetical protein
MQSFRSVASKAVPDIEMIRYEDWTRPHLVLDRSNKSIEEALEELFDRIRSVNRMANSVGASAG